MGLCPAHARDRNLESGGQVGDERQGDIRQLSPVLFPGRLIGHAPAPRRRADHIKDWKEHGNGGWSVK
ncbi:hypothetical protein GCM10022380_14680 [Amycolatopsis tucumanensis]|uniref:Uncharacterized protein n=1 Tax=Amycolatopsis tucumanensis TaxID=401106 RepID=A0ABP7HPH4_9PSEU